MKRFIFCIATLPMCSMVAVAKEAKVEMPVEADIGCVIEQQVCANVSIDGLTFTMTNYDIVAWQAPVMLNKVSATSAQVLNEICIPTSLGEFRMTLVCYRWPRLNSQIDSYALHFYTRPTDTFNSFSVRQTDYIKMVIRHRAKFQIVR